MKLYTDLELWSDEDKNLINSITEIPMNSMVKYEFNKDLNCVEVDRFFTTPMPMPYNYWFLPQSYNKDDGDPLDIILLSQYSIIPGCVVEANVIWVLHMIDWGEIDDKIIAIPKKEPFYKYIDSVDKIPQHLKNQIEFFLLNYKKLDNKETELKWWSDIETAKQLINECKKNYENK